MPKKKAKTKWRTWRGPSPLICVRCEDFSQATVVEGPPWPGQRGWSARAYCAEHDPRKAPRGARA